MSNDPNPYTSQNPYASPVEAAQVTFPGGESQGIWRRDKMLVMHKKAILPDRCVKTNQPTTRKLKRSLTWHHPAIFLAILANLLIYLILALALRKTAVIYIGLSEEHYERRKRNIWIAWGLFLLGVSLFFGAAVSMSPGSNELLVLGLIFGPIIIVIAALWGIYGCRVVYPKKIDNDYVYLKGVCEDYLAQFPPC